MNGKGIAEGLRRLTAQVVQGIGEAIDSELRRVVALGRPVTLDIGLVRDGRSWSLVVAEVQPGAPREPGYLRWDVSADEIRAAGLDGVEDGK